MDSCARIGFSLSSPSRPVLPGRPLGSAFPPFCLCCVRLRVRRHMKWPSSDTVLSLRERNNNLSSRDAPWGGQSFTNALHTNDKAQSQSSCQMVHCSFVVSYRSTIACPTNAHLAKTPVLLAGLWLPLSHPSAPFLRPFPWTSVLHTVFSQPFPKRYSCGFSAHQMATFPSCPLLMKTAPLWPLLRPWPTFPPTPPPNGPGAIGNVLPPQF